MGRKLESIIHEQATFVITKDALLNTLLDFSVIYFDGIFTAMVTGVPQRKTKRLRNQN